MRKQRPLFHNPISLFGVFLFLLATAFGLPLVILDLFRSATHPYLGVVIYMVLPLIAVLGVLVAFAGVAWERRRRKRRPELADLSLPVLDLNRPQHQAAAAGVLMAMVIAAVLLSVTGYRAYHFTDSVRFCGLVCHQVMKPEYTSYQHSPHARVACVACHVGSGTGWFVRSKLSGLYQVYAVASHSYPRPIPTPVKNLRPAPETCEQCHWPAKFFGSKQKVFTHTLGDETNSPWTIQMLVKVGGGDPKVGAVGGIHWHMNIKNKIEYITADERREMIPWVRATDPQGRVTEYQSTEHPLTPEQISSSKIRQMDCIDCHNRPTHIFHPADRAVEEAFEIGRLDRSLPFLKRESVRLLAGSYGSEGEALSTISRGLKEFYRNQYPAVFEAKGSVIQGAAGELQEMYRRNFFPEMKSDWRAYPDHAGHLNSDGCFRCHDGLHKSREGRIIPNGCSVCHTILAQGPPEEVAKGRLESQPFRHPVDVGADVTQFKCSQCHNGTSGL